MRIILSRKGFDSANGKIASPIFEDGTMLSFPIPRKVPQKATKLDDDVDTVRYDKLSFRGVSVAKILSDLGYKGVECCHLDPDLGSCTREKEPEEWVPAFGQINQSAAYLLNNEVQIQKNDLFLFFGNFRHVKCENGTYRYIRKGSSADDPYVGKDIQAIWGYLQVGEVITDPEEQKKFTWHPHSCDKRVYHEKNNIIFTAAEELSFVPGRDGCGCFTYDPKRVLTMQGKNKATWKPEPAYDLGNIVAVKGRKNSAKNEGIYYAGIWQELALKNENSVAEEWARSLF